MKGVTVDDANTQIATSGTFLGISVTTGAGGGLSGNFPVENGKTTHYRATHLPELGDTVLAVSRSFTTDTGNALGIDLRAFTATAPRRSSFETMSSIEFIDASGAIGFAELELSAQGDSSDERRAATLLRCVVTDASPTVLAARSVAEWLRTTWETELVFGSWPAIQGTLDAFSMSGGAIADWACD